MVALAEIPERGVDVLFLAIQMPRLDGFDLLERLPANFQVVFVIGRDQKDADRALERCPPCDEAGDAEASEPGARRARNATRPPRPRTDERAAEASG